MRTRTQEAAKFLAGAAASETLGHWWLGIWGKDMLPLKLGWFTFTPEMNWGLMAVWPLLLILFLHLGWGVCGGRSPNPAAQARFK